MVPVLILAGGLGSRLAHTVPHLPKALAPIQNTPFIHLLLRQIEKSALFSKIILALGHKASLIEQAALPSNLSIPIEISRESIPLGTGGAILNTLDRIESDVFMVMNGDSFFDISFSRFFHFFYASKASVSIACAPIPATDPYRYGTLQLDLSGRVLKFSEKTNMPTSHWISTGIYLMKKELFADLPLIQLSLENDLFPRFLEKGIFGYIQQATFIDIGTHESYHEAQNTLKPWL